jgi:hypothetical protein
MSDLDELPFGEPLTSANLGAAPARKCSHPRATRRLFDDGQMCMRCGKTLDATTARRGRNNRKRGNDVERVISKQLGLKRVGQFGGPTDVGESTDPFAVQVKSGGYFSEKYWDQLKRQTVASSQTALLVVTDAPGPGHRRRAMVVLDLDDWRALHGPSGVEGIR